MARKNFSLDGARWIHADIELPVNGRIWLGLHRNEDMGTALSKQGRFMRTQR
jgi:hypothetical protein